MRLLAVAALALVLAAPAAAADRQVLFGDGFRLDTADPGPFDRLGDGRLACLSDACANRTVSVGGVTVRVLPRVTAKQVAARQPAYRAPTPRRRQPRAGGSRTSCSSPARPCSPSSRPPWPLGARGRGRQAPVDRLLRALRLVRESAERAPPDRRRALDHLAATLGDAPPAERATRLAWSRPEPEPEPTLAIAEEVVR